MRTRLIKRKTKATRMIFVCIKCDGELIKTTGIDNEVTYTLYKCKKCGMISDDGKGIFSPNFMTYGK